MSVPPLDRRPVILEAECADPELTYRCRAMGRVPRITPITGWM
jgi:hypothetical protein